jgi:hypothetical protein
MQQKRRERLGGEDGRTVSSKFIAVMNETNALRTLDGIDQSVNTHATRKKNRESDMYVYTHKQKGASNERNRERITQMETLVNSFLTTLYQLQRTPSVE